MSFINRTIYYKYIESVQNVKYQIVDVTTGSDILLNLDSFSSENNNEPANQVGNLDYPLDDNPIINCCMIDPAKKVFRDTDTLATNERCNEINTIKSHISEICTDSLLNNVGVEYNCDFTIFPSPKDSYTVPVDRWEPFIGTCIEIGKLEINNNSEIKYESSSKSLGYNISGLDECCDLEDIEPSITALSPEEELVINMVIDNAADINKGLSMNYRKILTKQHLDVCHTLLLPCPYWHTQCCWIDHIPLISQHVRQMHDDKIVRKKKTGYIVNISHLEKLPLGFKLIQQYDGRLYIISMNTDTTSVIITVKITCESVTQHFDRCKALVLPTNLQGHHMWLGEAIPVCVPVAMKNRKLSALIINKKAFSAMIVPLLHMVVEVKV